MSINDWVLIGTAIFLGAVALFVPYFAELLKRLWFAPKIKISFNLCPPDCHKTWLKGQGFNEPVYYFRFKVTNEGKSQARKCEAVIEELYKADVAGNFHQIEYSPVNLKWGSGYDLYVDINPLRSYYCDLFYIPSLSFQQMRKSQGQYISRNSWFPFLEMYISTACSEPDNLV